MLKNLPERVRTVLIFAPIPIIMVLISPFTTWLLLLLIQTIGLYELRKISTGIANYKDRGFLIYAGFPALALVFALFGWYFVALATIFGLAFALVFEKEPQGRELERGLVVISLAAISAYAIRSGHHGLRDFLMVFFVVAASDIGAYYVGKTYGKRKLAPSISPNKTIEGSIGGIGAAALVGAIWSVLTTHHDHHFVSVFFMGLLFGAVLSVVSQAGDLLESSFKRKHGVKDSSDIFPGHGGILDRFDAQSLAFIFAAMFLAS